MQLSEDKFALDRGLDIELYFNFVSFFSDPCAGFGGQRCRVDPDCTRTGATLWQQRGLRSGCKSLVLCILLFLRLLPSSNSSGYAVERGDSIHTDTDMVKIEAVNNKKKNKIVHDFMCMDRQWILIQKRF